MTDRTPARRIEDQLGPADRTHHESGRLVEAARDWMTEWANEEELASLEQSGWLEASAEHVPVLLRMIEAGQDDGYSPTDPSVLGQVTAPLLVLLGSDARAPWSWFADSAQYVAEHAGDASLREIPGAGHCGVWVQPERHVQEMHRRWEARGTWPLRT